MPIHSRHTPSLTLPYSSVPTYLFTSPTTPLPTTPLLHSTTPTSTPSHLSLSTYRLYAQRFALGLQRAGLHPGDRVLLFAPNSLFTPVFYQAVLMAGGIFTGANPGSTPRELLFQLSDSGASWVFAGIPHLGVARRAARKAGVPAHRVFAFDDHPDVEQLRSMNLGVRRWKELFAEEGEARAWMWVEEPERAAALNYSSGTTGLPKGVVLSHANIVATSAQMRHVETLGLGEGVGGSQERWVAVLPMFHAIGQVMYLTVGPKRGVRTWIMEGFEFGELLGTVQRVKATELVLVPPLIVLLAKHPAVEKFDLRSLRRIVSGGAPLSEELCELMSRRWEKMGGEMKVRQAWGMTEMTCAVLGFAPRAVEPTASVGELVAHAEGMLVSLEDGKTEITERGQRGEIWIRSPGVMKEYWQNQEATRETLTRDGWLKTGDVGVVDEKGRWFIVDRIKELIKVKGHQVAPAELEALLLQHPDVADAAVVGITLPNAEEHPRAYIVLQQGAKLSPAGICEEVSRDLIKYKRITGGAIQVDEIPKLKTGKILRKDLRKRAQQEIDETGVPKL